MQSSNVLETSTSTGAGNISLTSASAGMPVIRFSDDYAIKERFCYQINAKDGSEYEAGIGYLFDANTMVREKVLKSSNAGALVNFSAGEKYVFIAQSTLVSPHITPYVRSWSRFPNYDTGTMNVTVGTNRLYILPLVVPCEMTPSELGVDVTSASAGAIARLGIAQQIAESTWRTVADLGTISCATTSYKSVANTFKMKKGLYYAFLVANDGVQIRGNRIVSDCGLGMLFGSTKYYMYQDNVDPSLPFDEEYNTTNGVNNATPPNLLYRA